MRAMLLACVLAAGLMTPAPLSAQIVSPDQIATIAKTIHDREGWNLGASSSRETRNEFWALAIGVVHWGHPVYNPTPDPSWCLKDGGGGRPQTDDVATQCVSRLYWDCIGGVGSNGYENNFRCMGHGNERLPAVQNVYPPPKPKGWTGTPAPPPTPGTAALEAAVAALAAKLDQVITQLTALEDPLNRAAYESLNAANRASEIKTQIANLPSGQPIIAPVYRGSVFGRGITLRPVQELDQK